MTDGKPWAYEAAQLMRALAGAPDTETTIESLKGLVALIERSHGAAAEELAELARAAHLLGCAQLRVVLPRRASVQDGSPKFVATTAQNLARDQTTGKPVCVLIGEI